MRRLSTGILVVIILPLFLMSGCSSRDEDKPAPDPNEIPKLLGEAGTETRRGELNKAIATYDEVLKIAPNNLTALANRAVLFTLQNKKDVTAREVSRIRKQQAVELQSKLDKTPNNTALLIQLSLNQSAQGNHTAAISNAEKATKIQANAQSYFVLANALHRNKNYSGALKNYNKAIQLDAKMVEAYLARANNKKKLGDHRGAESDFNMVNKLHSNDGISNN